LLAEKIPADEDPSLLDEPSLTESPFPEGEEAQTSSWETYPVFSFSKDRSEETFGSFIHLVFY
jgi:hypothetical protein